MTRGARSAKFPLHNHQPRTNLAPTSAENHGARSDGRESDHRRPRRKGRSDHRRLDRHRRRAGARIRRAALARRDQLSFQRDRRAKISRRRSERPAARRCSCAATSPSRTNAPRIVEATAAHFGRLDGLINNAGLMLGRVPSLEAGERAHLRCDRPQRALGDLASRARRRPGSSARAASSSTRRRSRRATAAPAAPCSTPRRRGSYRR